MSIYLIVGDLRTYSRDETKTIRFSMQLDIHATDYQARKLSRFESITNDISVNYSINLTLHYSSKKTSRRAVVFYTMHDGDVQRSGAVAHGIYDVGIGLREF